MNRSTLPPTRDDIAATAGRLPSLVLRTPCVPSPWLSALTGADVRLKLEMIQPTGSFKIRGAVNALAALRTSRPNVTRVVTASAGNHGQAVALAARHAGVRVRVWVPASAPAAKRDAMRRLGAEVLEVESYDAAEHAALAAAGEDDDVYVPPYNDAHVIAGAGTVGLEILADVPETNAILVPLGGGGLLSGIGIVAKAAGHHVLVIGTEADASPVFTRSLSAGRIVAVDVQPTLADGLAGNLEPGSMTFDLVRRVCDRVVAVNEQAIAAAMADLIRHERLVVEGASATAVAALRVMSREDLASRVVVVVLSGRNVDSTVIRRVLDS